MKNNTYTLFFQYSNEFLHRYIPLQRGMSPNTEKAYCDGLTLFHRYALEVHGLGADKLTFEQINFVFMNGFIDWLDRPRNGRKKGDNATTKNHRITAVRSYAKFAMSKDISVSSAWISMKNIAPVKGEKADRPAMSENAIATMLRQPSTETKRGIRDLCLMIVLYDSAGRISEVLGLKKEDIRLEGEHPQIFIRGKGRKERPIPLMPRTVKHLKAYLAVYHDDNKVQPPYLFYSVIKGVAGQLSQDCVSKMLKKYEVTARLECSEMPDNIYCHMFRRTRATHMYQQGADIYLISSFLGHEQIETTKQYTKPSMQQIKAALEASSPKDESGKPIVPEKYEERLARLCGLRR